MRTITILVLFVPFSKIHLRRCRCSAIRIRTPGLRARSCSDVTAHVVPILKWKWGPNDSVDQDFGVCPSPPGLLAGLGVGVGPDETTCRDQGGGRPGASSCQKLQFVLYACNLHSYYTYIIMYKKGTLGPTAPYSTVQQSTTSSCLTDNLKRQHRSCLVRDGNR